MHAKMKLYVIHPSGNPCPYDPKWAKSSSYQSALCRSCGYLSEPPPAVDLGSRPEGHYAFSVIGRNVIEIISSELKDAIEGIRGATAWSGLTTIPVTVGGKNSDQFVVYRESFDDRLAIRGSEKGIFTFCPTCGTRAYGIVGQDQMVPFESIPSVFFASNGGLVIDRNDPMSEDLLKGFLNNGGKPYRLRKIRFVSQVEDDLPECLSQVMDPAYHVMDLRAFKKARISFDPGLPIE